MDTIRASGIIFLIGRLLVGGVYLEAGISNILYRPAKASYAASKGVVAADLLVLVAAVLLLVAGLSFLLGFRPQIGILAITLFLLPVTLIMHNFWAAEGLMREIESHAFESNLIMLGSALLLIAIPRPWAHSLDEWLAGRRHATARPGEEREQVAATSASRWSG
jgi:uncharacterized membrane protein YphA (DoxX/SURF4 family)